jgi:hypothetical protein
MRLEPVPVGLIPCWLPLGQRVKPASYRNWLLACSASLEERLQESVHLLVIEARLAHDRRSNQVGPTSRTTQPKLRSLAPLQNEGTAQPRARLKIGAWPRKCPESEGPHLAGANFEMSFSAQNPKARDCRLRSDCVD